MRPEVVVAMGATAAQALLGPSFRLTQHRGDVMRDTGLAAYVMATAHPSMILRLPDHGAREEARHQLAADLSQAASLLT